MAAALGWLTVIALGLSAGALLAEGAVLVPFWRSAEPRTFLDWYAEHAGLLFRFFAPLEIGSAILAVAAALLHGIRRRPAWALAAALSLLVLLAFPVYFEDANASFASGSLAPEAVGDALATWARWHWGRTGLMLVAFATAVSALRQRS